MYVFDCERSHSPQPDVSKSTWKLFEVLDWFKSIIIQSVDVDWPKFTRNHVRVKGSFQVFFIPLKNSCAHNSWLEKAAPLTVEQFKEQELWLLHLKHSFWVIFLEPRNTGLQLNHAVT